MSSILFQTSLLSAAVAKFSVYSQLLLSFLSSQCKSLQPSLLILQPPLYLRLESVSPCTLGFQVSRRVKKNIRHTFLSQSLLRNMNIFRSTYIQLLMFFILIPSIRTATFKYKPGFETDMKRQGDATFANDGIQLTTNRVDKFLNSSTGRALYARPVRLWDSATGEVANFSSRFSFRIKPGNGNDDLRGDGLAFFLAPSGSTILPFSGGALLGLFNDSVKFNSSENPAVAVEFDTYYNKDFDPTDYPIFNCHVGVDINSIKSVNTSQYECSLFLHNETDAWISYDSSTKYLSIHVSPASASNSSSSRNIFLSYSVDLKDILPEWVDVGLTAATGASFETHQILSWEFYSTQLPSRAISIISPSPAPSPSIIQSVVRKPEHEQKTDNTKLVIGLVVGIPLFIVGVGMILFMWQKKGNRKSEGQVIILGKPAELPTDDEYELKGGPTKYSYSELVRATDDFKEDRKLGEGGFGSVYRGMLSDSNVQVAVKKVSKDSKQGKKEFASEVTIIGKLVHRNLVRLLGWCHEQGDFLLVYEFLPNGSLDFHLFRGRTMLTWVLRYKIANDLASALLYLHEGWYQCVVHRDIKSSNILLDSDFNAKLGDFGLARFADHAEGLKTTILGGTKGYIAPECFHTGKSSKESDIYSFGVVVLEIACGRMVLVPNEEENKVRLISWVWELYASGRLLEAVDTKLCMDFDEEQMERLMVVGLWCTAYDYNIRPSIKQVSSILNMEAPLPDLTMKIPLSTNFMPSMQNHGFSPASSSSITADYQGRTSGSTHNTSSSHSSYASLLQSEPR